MGTMERVNSVPRRSSLRLVLVTLFVLLVSATVVLTGFLSFRSGRQSVFEMVDRLRSEIATRIEEDLRRFFAIARDVAHLNRDVAFQGLLNIDDLPTWQGYLWHQSRLFPSLTKIAAGNEKGEYIAIDRQNGGQAVGQFCDATTGFALFTYEVGDMGVPASPAKNAGPYDPRSRPWYRSPTEAHQPHWSKVFKHFVDPALQIAFSLPVYDASGTLKGVTTAAVRLSEITAFLQGNRGSPNGLAYIVDESGQLVASSADEPVFSMSSEGEVLRMRAEESPVALIRQSARALTREVGDWVGVDGRISLDDAPEGERLFVQVMPFKDTRGLDWRIVVVIPESDFMAQIHKNVKTTLVLCLLALGLALAVGLLTVRWIVGPILLINAAAEDLVAGREVRNLPTDRGDELGSLARTFDRMAREVRRSMQSLKSELAERRRAEAALRESEAQYRSIFENAIEGIFRSTPEGRFLSVNPAFARIYGYDSPEEMIQSVADIGKDIYVRQEDRARLISEIERSDVSTGLEQEVRRKDGSVGWVSVSARSVRNERGELIHLDGFAVDITERKRAEEALKLANLVVENSSVVLFRWRAVEGWPVDMVSENVRQFGYSPDELRSGAVPFSSIVHPDDLARVAHEVQFYSAAGVDRFQQEYRIVSKDGRVRWVEDRTLLERDGEGQISFFQGIVIDITERKLAEDALRQEMHFTDTLIDSMPGIFYVFDEQGRLARWSKQLERATGYDAATVSGMRALEFFLPEDRESVARKIQEVFLEGRSHVEGRILTKDGQAVPFFLTGLRIAAGDKSYLVGVGLDLSERVRAEAEAARLQSLLQSVILQSPVPMVLALPDGTIELVNESCRSVLGAPKGTAHHSGLNLFTLEASWINYSADGREVPASELPITLALMGKTTRSREMRVLRLDGTERWILVDAVPVCNEDGAVLAGFLTFVDITERKQAEAALRESEERFSVFMDNLPAGVFMKDSGGKVVYANRYLRELFGWGDVVGKSTRELLPAEAAARMEADDRAALVGGLTTVAEWVRDIANRERIFQTSKFPIPREGRPPLLGGIAIDITDRNRAEEELRASEAFLETIIQHSPFSMWVSDSTGTMIRMNQACRTLLRGTEEELVGRYNLFTDNVLESRGVMPLVRRVFEQGETVRFMVDYDSSELSTVHVAETRRVVLEATISPVLDARGQVAHAIVQQLDLSERRQAEEALRNSLLEKESLLKEVHHRVKNNLQVISSLLKLQARKIHNPEVHEVLRDTQNRVRSMALLHETLYRSGDLAKVRFPQYVKNVCSHVARSYGAGAENVRLRHEIVDVTLDLDLAIPAGLIINELVSNALKHAFPSDSTGEILVELRSEPEGRLVLRVSDDGVGLPPAMDPGTTETLGLLLVRNLARQLDGRMSVTSEHGTVFEIAFPAHSA